MIHCEVHSDEEPFELDSGSFELGQQSEMRRYNRKVDDISNSSSISSTSFSKGKSQMISAATSVDDF